MKQQLASVSLRKLKKSYIVFAKGFIERKKKTAFIFDTGASITLIGINTLIGNDKESFYRMKYIIEQEIMEKGVLEHGELLKTATEEQIQVYPCKCEGVSIEGMREITFYFHIYPGRVGMPLLGFDYIDDCTFSHGMGGTVNITSVSEKAGKRFYAENVLDLRKIMQKFQHTNVE